jgi:hypothetical protein
MFIKQTLLFVMLIAANLVATSAPKSAWALSPERLPPSPLERAELIIAIIRLHAPSRDVAERMVAIASCEVTRFQHTLPNGRLKPNRRGSGAAGIFQLMPMHLRAARARGLSPERNLHDYIRVALSLVENRRRSREDLFTDWNASRACWSTGGRTQSELAALRRESLVEVAEAR